MIVTKIIQVPTTGFTDIIDITHDVEKVLTESNVNDGIVTVYVAHSTAGITVMEFEKICSRPVLPSGIAIAPGPR